MRQQVISVIIVVVLLVVAAMGCGSTRQSTQPTGDLFSILLELLQDPLKARQAMVEEFKDSPIIEHVRVDANPTLDGSIPVAQVTITLKEGITLDRDQKNQIKETAKRLVLENFRVRPTKIEVNLISPTTASSFISLMEAALRGNTEKVQAMLAEGADVNGKDRNGYTALMCAAAAGNADTAKVLLANGADVDVKDNKGATALICAAWGMGAAGEGFLNTVKILLEHGADVSIRDGVGDTALAAGATGGNPDIVRILLEHGANANERNNGGFTALMNAAIAGHVGAVRVLLENGADVGLRDMHGSTALTWARKKEIIQILKKAGARE